MSWRLSTITLVICGLGLLLQMIVTYVVDPDGLYRPDRASLTGESMWDEMLVAKYGRGNALMLGTSLSERTNYDEFSRLVGKKVLNSSGGTNLLTEQAKLATFALDRRKLDTIYWAMFLNLRDPFGVKPQFPSYALNDWFIDDWRYLLSGAAFRRAVKALVTGRLSQPGDFDSPHRAWSPSEYNRKKALEARGQLARAWKKSRLFATLDEVTMRRALRTRVAPIVAAHPDVHFVFFLPPVGIFGLQEADIRLRAQGLTMARFDSIIVEELGKFRNSEVDDFQRKNLVTDFNQLADAIHSSEKISNAVARGFASGAYRVTPNTYPQRASELEGMITTFSPPPQ